MSDRGEFYTDGTCVNTRQGWREMRLGVFAKRPAGEPASPQRWRDRQLPATTIGAAFCEIADSETFGGRWAGYGWKVKTARWRSIRRSKGYGLTNDECAISASSDSSGIPE